MTLTEIENLSFADLKSKKDELLAGLIGADAAEVAARYIQARTDAKQRDEKLAEQALTLKALQDGLQAATEKAYGLDQRLASVIEQAKANQAAAEARDVKAHEEAQAAKAAFDELHARCSQEAARASQAEALARARRVALADVMKVISPVLAAE